MKKIIISTSIVVFTCLSFTVFANRAEFEEKMYGRYRGRLSKKEYKKNIKPFLDEAENNLKAVQFCEKNQYCVECQKYYSDLLEYNVACFNNYLRGNKKTGRVLDEKKLILKDNIRALAQKGALEQDKIEKELQKTEQLFFDSNKSLYVAFPISKKLSIWWHR